METPTTFGANGTFVPPISGTYQIECWGSGGNGAAYAASVAGGGGGGGGYSIANVAMIAGTGYAVVVDQGGGGGSTSCAGVSANSGHNAVGATGGAAGTGATNNGGAGANGTSTTTGGGGGGGAANGSAGSAASGSTHGAGGTIGSGSAAGGDGGNGATVSGPSTSPSSTAGGGAGGQVTYPAATAGSSGNVFITAFATTPANGLTYSRPTEIYSPSLFTYRDAIDHLLVVEDALGQEIEQKRARGAIQSAYRRLHAEHKWRHLVSLGRVFLQAPLTDSTIVFDSIANTLSSNSFAWPADIAVYRALSGGVTAKIQSGSGTIAQLDPTFTFPNSAPWTSGAIEVTFAQTIYPLPAGLTDIGEIHDQNSFWSTTYVSPGEWLSLERHFHSATRPWFWTIMGHPDLQNQLALCIYGRPSGISSFDFVYQRKPRDLRLDGYARYSSQGTNFISAASPGSTAATLHAAVPPAVAGSVLRLAQADGDRPPGGLDDIESYGDQRIVTAVSSMVLTVDSGWTTGKAESTGHFSLSDPVDLPDYLIQPFLRLCEAEYAQRQQDDARIKLSMGAYQEALVLALGNDAMVPSPTPGDWSGWRWPGIGLVQGAPFTANSWIY